MLPKDAYQVSPLGDVDIQSHEPDGRVFVLFREIRNTTTDARKPVGRIEIESLGTVVGTMDSFTLKRRAEKGDEALLYDLSAVLRFVNPTLFGDPDYVKSVVVRVGNKEYRLVQSEGRETALNGKTLTMKGVSLWVA
jgi:hypothetical protein